MTKSKLQNVRVYVKDFKNEDGSVRTSYSLSISGKAKEEGAKAPRVFIPVTFDKALPKVSFKNGYADLNLEGSFSAYEGKDAVAIRFYVEAYTYYKEVKEAGIKTQPRVAFMLEHGFSGEEIDLMSDEDFKKAFKEAYAKSQADAEKVSA